MTLKKSRRETITDEQRQHVFLFVFWKCKREVSDLASPRKLKPKWWQRGFQREGIEGSCYYGTCMASKNRPLSAFVSDAQWKNWLDDAPNHPPSLRPANPRPSPFTPPDHCLSSCRIPSVKEDKEQNRRSAVAQGKRKTPEADANTNNIYKTLRAVRNWKKE